MRLDDVGGMGAAAAAGGYIATTTTTRGEEIEYLFIFFLNIRKYL